MTGVQTCALPIYIGGYYAPDPVRTAAVMRPSPTFNAALDLLA